MLYRSSRFLLGFSLALIFVACGDDSAGPGAPPPPANPRDAAVDLPDSGVPVVPPAISRCEADAPVQIGEIDEEAISKPDGVDVIAHPNNPGEFLVVTAQPHCPEAPEGNCDGMTQTGPETWVRRRALLYSVSEQAGAAPNGPHMVNLGVVQGLVSFTATTEPRLAVSGGNVIVAWLDTTDFQPRNVWAAAVNASTLEPLGGQNRISEIAASEDIPSASWRAASKLHVIAGSSSVDVVYQVYGRDDAAPTLHAATISPSTGQRVGANRDLGEIAHSEGSHDAIRNAAGEIVFGRTERLEGTECSFKLARLGEEAEAVEEDKSGGPCSDIALANGGTVYVTDNGGSLRFRPLGAAGTPIGRERKLLEMPRGTKASRPAIAAFTNGFFVTFIETSADGERLRGLIVDAQGGVISEETLLNEPRREMSAPSIAITQGGNTIAIAWKDRFGATTNHRTNLLRVRCE